MEQVPLIPEAIIEVETDALGRPLQTPNGGNGRPRGSHNHSRRLYEEELSPLERRHLIRVTYNSAIAGNPYDRRSLLDRIWPKQRSAPIETELPPTATPADLRRAMHETLARVAAGELTTDDGAALVSILKDILAAHSIETLTGSNTPENAAEDAPALLLERINRVIDEKRRRVLSAPADESESAA